MENEKPIGLLSDMTVVGFLTGKSNCGPVGSSFAVFFGVSVNVSWGEDSSLASCVFADIRSETERYLIAECADRTLKSYL